MDQKKTLWIIAAVGAFLLVILVPAFIMYPKAPKVEQTITRTLPEQKKPAADEGWNPPAPVTVPNELAVNDLTVFAENANVIGFGTSSETSSGTTIDLNALRNETAASTVAPVQDINITVEIKEPETKPVTDTSDYYVAKTEEKTVTQKVTKVEPKPAATETAPAKTTTTTSTATKTNATSSVKVTATTKAPATKTQYWVQVAAYSSKKTAEGARAVLDANKITADIFTYKDSKDNLFYRVRVGPYTTKSEAEYWRSKIIKINEFSKAESYITSTNTEL